jgi:hypothetical protein
MFKGAAVAGGKGMHDCSRYTVTSSNGSGVPFRAVDCIEEFGHYVQEHPERLLR